MTYIGGAMLFHTFNSRKRENGGSALVEMQWCTLPAGTDIRKIVAVDSITNWRKDSLYIDDEDTFYREYSRIFNCGIYSNLKSGVVDVCGINYYAPSFIDPIMEKMLREKPVDYELPLEWLDKAKAYNGFYILGI